MINRNQSNLDSQKLQIKPWIIRFGSAFVSEIKQVKYVLQQMELQYFFSCYASTHGTFRMQ